MFKTRRRAALGVTAVATAVSMLALAAPAEAVTVPDWVTGTVPVLSSTCTLGTVFDDATHVYNMPYTDTSYPTITDVSFAGTTVVAVGPGAGTSVPLTVKASESCGGVGFVQMLLVHGGTYVSYFPAPATADVFHATMTTPFQATSAGAGVYQPGLALVNRRYDSFRLGSSFELISSVPVASGTVYSTGSWSTKKLYVLRKSTLTNTLSAVKLAKGKTVKATAVLKFAGASAYGADAGGKVAVQTKVGTGRWVTNATLTANASGVVTYSFVLAATTQVRFVHPRTLSGNFTESVISPIKVVTKI